jgi:hypothetical protein
MNSRVQGLIYGETKEAQGLGSQIHHANNITYSMAICVCHDAHVIYIYIYIYTYTYTHTHTHIYIYIHRPNAHAAFHSRASSCIKQWECMEQRYKRIQAEHSSRCHSDSIIAICHAGTGFECLLTISYVEKFLFHLSLKCFMQVKWKG